MIIYGSVLTIFLAHVRSNDEGCLVNNWLVLLQVHIIILHGTIIFKKAVFAKDKQYSCQVHILNRIGNQNVKLVQIQNELFIIWTTITYFKINLDDNSIIIKKYLPCFYFESNISSIIMPTEWTDVFSFQNKSYK